MPGRTRDNEKLCEKYNQVNKIDKLILILDFYLESLMISLSLSLILLMMISGAANPPVGGTGAA